jgi:hypothetical protein
MGCDGDRGVMCDVYMGCDMIREGCDDTIREKCDRGASAQMTDDR